MMSVPAFALVVVAVCFGGLVFALLVAGADFLAERHLSARARQARQSWRLQDAQQYRPAPWVERFEAELARRSEEAK